jgi:hypothetical protein
MDSLRRHRRWLPGWLVPVLLFAQIATAAYACAPTVSMDTMAVAAMAEMPDCHVGEGATPALCKAHCEPGQQSVNSQAGAANVPAPALIDARWLRPLVCADAAQATRPPLWASTVGPPDGTPPLYLQLLVLRN